MELEFRLRLAHSQLHTVITSKGLWTRASLSEQLRDKTLEELGFSARVVHALRGKNINTIQDLTKASRTKLMKTRNIGITSMREIDRFLVQHGLQINP